MRHMVSRFFKMLRGPAMDPEEIEERVEILEAKVRANRLLIDQHQADRTAHVNSPKVNLDQ